MVLAVTACLVGLAAVLYAVYTDAPIAAPAPAAPDWEPLPTPADVARGDFPLAFPGYDPASVESHFEQLRRAYAVLYAAAPPEVLERARQRAAMEEGRPVGSAVGLWEPPASAPLAGDPDWAAAPPATDGDDLRLEAALTTVDPPPEDRP